MFTAVPWWSDSLLKHHSAFLDVVNGVTSIERPPDMSGKFELVPSASRALTRTWPPGRSPLLLAESLGPLFHLSLQLPTCRQIQPPGMKKTVSRPSVSAEGHSARSVLRDLSLGRAGRYLYDTRTTGRPILMHYPWRESVGSEHSIAGALLIASTSLVAVERLGQISNARNTSAPLSDVMRVSGSSRVATFGRPNPDKRTM